MLALETVEGYRLAADAADLDKLIVENVLVLRFAPDDVFGVLLQPDGWLDLENSSTAIVVKEAGFVGCWLSSDELAVRVLAHVDWALPEARPVLAQGLIAGVPAKLWLESGRALLLCAAAHAHELADRLG